MADDNKVIIGKIGAPHGVKGWMRMISFTDPAEKVFDYQPWLIKEKQGWHPVKLVAHERHDKIFVIAIEGCYDRDAAKLLTNCELAIDRERLPELDKGGYYWHDLIGCAVVNERNQHLGTVIQMLDTGSNDVMIVDAKPQIAIPFYMDEIVLAVDLTHKVITVKWEIEHE